MAAFSLATQTLFAELLQRCLDAEFDELYSERGRFVRVRSAGRLYWHYRAAVKGKRHQLYVGPVADKSITDRVKRFGEIKSDFNYSPDLFKTVSSDWTGRLMAAKSKLDAAETDRRELKRLDDSLRNNLPRVHELLTDENRLRRVEHSAFCHNPEVQKCVLDACAKVEPSTE